MQQMNMFSSKISPEFALTPEREQLLMEAGVIGVDTETSNELGRLLEPFQRDYFLKRKMGLAQVTTITHVCLWCPSIPKGVVLGEDDLKDPHTLAFLRKLFSTSNATFVAHNYVFDMRLLYSHLNLAIPKKAWDTYILEMVFGDADPKGGTVINADTDFGDEDDYDDDDMLAVNTATKSFSLIGLLKQYHTVEHLQKKGSKMVAHLCESLMVLADWFSVKVEDPNDLVELFTNVYPKMKTQRTVLDKMPGDVVGHYVYLDTALAVYLMQSQVKRIKYMEPDYPHLMEVIEWECRFTRYCAAISGTGLGVNRKYLLESMDVWAEQARQAANNMLLEVVQHAEENGQSITATNVRAKGLNPMKRADQQLYFIQTHNIKTPAKNPQTQYLYTDKGAVSFNKKAMEYYIERYPQLKSYSDYSTAMRKIAKGREILAHLWHNHVFSIIDAGVVTSRTRSANINLQNLNMKYHKKQRNFTGIFQAPPGFMYIGYDISNGETWMGAWLAKDNVLMAVLANEDFHTKMAKTYFPFLDWDNLSPDEFKFWRGLSKAITFGNAYGMGPKKMAQDANLHEALKMREDQMDWKDRLLMDDDLLRQFLNILPMREYLGVPFQIKAQEWGHYMQQARATLYEMDMYSFGFIMKIWNANQVLLEKARAYPATAKAKEEAVKFAERHGYICLWDGRRVFMRQPHKAWNAMCQGGLSVVTKRWCVLAFEAFEKYNFLEISPASFIHDEKVQKTPIEYAELCTKIIINSLNQVMDTHPYDKAGVHWSQRTTPSVQFKTEVIHYENAHKWGQMAGQEYPFDIPKTEDEFKADQGLTWATDEGWEADLERASTVQAREAYFRNKRFVWEGHPDCEIGQPGLSLPQYVSYLDLLRSTERNSEAAEILDQLDRVAVSFQTELGQPTEGLKAWLTS